MSIVATSARACIDGDEVLTPVLDPLHGTSEAGRGGDDDQLVAQEEVLHAEPTADVAAAHADEMLGDTGEAGAHLARLVRVLGRQPDVELTARRLVRRQHAARLHRDVGVAVLHEALADHVRRAGQRRVEIGVGRRRHRHRNVRPELRVHEIVRRPSDRGIDDRVERLVLDLDELGRVLGHVPALCDHERDRVTDEADVTLGEGAHRRAGGRGVLALEHGRLEGAQARVEIRGGEHGAHAGDGRAPRPRRRGGCAPGRGRCGRTRRAACRGRRRRRRTSRGR